MEKCDNNNKIILLIIVIILLIIYCSLLCFLVIITNECLTAEENENYPTHIQLVIHCARRYQHRINNE